MDSNEDLCKPKNFIDPDIAGIGVLVSLGISSLVTIAAIFAAYVKSGLQPDRYTAIDEAIITRIFRQKKPDERVQAHLTYAFETFIKTMADQQLFTGVSLVIAIYLVRYEVADLDLEVSAYSYCMAVYIALLSSVIHLSAITVLRDHFNRAKRLRDIRIALMITSIVLLLPQLAQSQQLSDPSISLRCAVDPPPTIHWGIDPIEHTVYVSTVGIVVVINCGFLRRLLELYSVDFRESPERWVVSICATTLRRPTLQEQRQFNQAALKHREALLEFIARDPTSIAEILILGGRILFIVIDEVHRSFLIEMAWLLFYVTFAICQIALFIRIGPFYEDETESVIFGLGFGQILALALLGLPFLSAFDIYTEWAEFAKGFKHDDRIRDASIPEPSQILYNTCISLHRTMTRTFTWIVVVLSSVGIILAGIALSTLFWRFFPTSMKFTFAIVLFCFVLLSFSLLYGFLKNCSWILTRRYLVPHEEDRNIPRMQMRTQYSTTGA